MTVRQYPHATPLRDVANWLIGILAFIGLPVAFGCLIFMRGGTRLEAFFLGVGFILVPVAVVQVRNYLLWRRMRRVLGRPLQAGERVRVISGPLTGKVGLVQFPGQYGPLELYVKIEDSPDDESLIMQWKHLRRVE